MKEELFFKKEQEPGRTQRCFQKKKRVEEATPINFKGKTHGEEGEDQEFGLENRKAESGEFYRRA